MADDVDSRRAVISRFTEHRSGNRWQVVNCLRRLGVDYINLYQIHWPDRYVPMFGETEYDPNRQYTSVPMEEQLEALGRAIDAGKNQLAGLQHNDNGYTFRKVSLI
ncbi:Aldo-keto reductase [Zea mays]|uniref:Aldo-keto reductase n=1 Tax=Zea mays TaxID=4577 RepID=A0A3L6FEF1_MAIZE|nr:Aldo-keto reductase [Zea mays]